VNSPLLRKSSFWLCVLILLYWLTRVVALDSLAYFIDESNHLWWARTAWQGFPFQAASDGRLLNVLWMAVFWPFNAGVWVSRFSVILITTVGVACIGDSARRMGLAQAGKQSAALAMLSYTFMPLAFFFDRMALADSLSGPFVAITLWATIRLYQTPAPFNRRASLWAIIGGLALTAAIFSKISNVIFLCIPAIAVLLLVPWAQWRQSVLKAGAIYAACLMSLLPLALIVKIVGQSDLGLDILTRKTGTPLEAIPQQIMTNLGVVGEQAAAYLSFPLWAILIVSIGVAVWKGRRAAWFAMGVLVITLGVLIVRTDPAFLESRYLPAYAPLLAALAGAGLATARFGKKPGLWLNAALFILPGIVFVVQGWVQPEGLPLTTADRFQYIEGWPSGYGFRDAAADLIAKGQTGKLVTLDLGGFERFEAYLLGRTERLTADQVKNNNLADVLLVLDRPKDDEAVAGKTWTLTEIGRYPRPGGQSALVVYRVQP